MTKLEAETLYNEEAKQLKVVFVGYYKYLFTFRGETERMGATFTFGGDADSIYKHKVDTLPKAAPCSFRSIEDDYMGVSITDKATGSSFEASYDE